MRALVLHRSILQAFVAALTASTVSAQTNAGLAIESLVTVSSDSAAALRTSQLEIRGLSADYLLRSTSSLLRDPRKDGQGSSFRLIAPAAWLFVNSALPSGENDGALWAGKGPNARVIAGVDAGFHGLRVTLLPELAYSSNEFFEYGQLFVPSLQAGRNPYSSPWNGVPVSIDAPPRFGPGKTVRVSPGQSSVSFRSRGVELGITTENEWWGPGIRTAIVLSDNAEGFPRAFIRTSTPRNTRIGTFAARLTWGGLSESKYFDSDPSNDLRYWSAFAATWTPRMEPDLTLGVARAVFANAGSWGAVAARPFNAFLPARRSAQTSITDSSFVAGRDQIFSLFGRWVFPGYGFEAYGELARAELPSSVRDLLEDPGHSQGYTFGVQWIGAPTSVGKLRVQAEHSYLEHDPSFARRPVESFYTSRSVQQGYTNRGQVIGAGMGQGSSGEWLATDLLGNRFGVGAFVSRTRFNNDAYFLLPFPYGGGHCEHDVTFGPGIRGFARTPFGKAALEYRSAMRDNAYFQNLTSCSLASPYIDVRNQILSISLTLGR